MADGDLTFIDWFNDTHNVAGQNANIFPHGIGRGGATGTLHFNRGGISDPAACGTATGEADADRAAIVEKRFRHYLTQDALKERNADTVRVESLSSFIANAAAFVENGPAPYMTDAVAYLTAWATAYYGGMASEGISAANALLSLNFDEEWTRPTVAAITAAGGWETVANAVFGTPVAKAELSAELQAFSTADALAKGAAFVTAWDRDFGLTWQARCIMVGVDAIEAVGGVTLPVYNYNNQDSADSDILYDQNGVHPSIRVREGYSNVLTYLERGNRAAAFAVDWKRVHFIDRRNNLAACFNEAGFLGANVWMRPGEAIGINEFVVTPESLIYNVEMLRHWVKGMGIKTIFSFTDGTFGERQALSDLLDEHYADLNAASSPGSGFSYASPTADTVTTGPVHTNLATLLSGGGSAIVNNRTYLKSLDPLTLIETGKLQTSAAAGLHFPNVGRSSVVATPQAKTRAGQETGLYDDATDPGNKPFFIPRSHNTTAVLLTSSGAVPAIDSAATFRIAYTLDATQASWTGNANKRGQDYGDFFYQQEGSNATTGKMRAMGFGTDGQLQATSGTLTGTTFTAGTTRRTNLTAPAGAATFLSAGLHVIVVTFTAGATPTITVYHNGVELTTVSGGLWGGTNSTAPRAGITRILSSFTDDDTDGSPSNNGLQNMWGQYPVIDDRVWTADEIANDYATASQAMGLQAFIGGLATVADLAPIAASAAGAGMKILKATVATDITKSDEVALTLPSGVTADDVYGYSIASTLDTNPSMASIVGTVGNSAKLSKPCTFAAGEAVELTRQRGGLPTDPRALL